MSLDHQHQKSAVSALAGAAGPPSSSMPPVASSSACAPLSPGPSSESAAQQPAAALLAWDEPGALSEAERLERLASMDAGDLRLLAASQPVIEQAKGVLMGCYGCDAETAFVMLRRVSSRSNAKLRDVAAIVVNAVTDPPAALAGGSPPERLSRVVQYATTPRQARTRPDPA